MSSAICFNSDQSKILSSGNGLKDGVGLFSLEPNRLSGNAIFVDSVDQNQTAQNVESDLGSTLSDMYIFFTQNIPLK